MVHPPTEDTLPPLTTLTCPTMTCHHLIRAITGEGLRRLLREREADGVSVVVVCVSLSMSHCLMSEGYHGGGLLLRGREADGVSVVVCVSVCECVWVGGCGTQGCDCDCEGQSLIA